MFEECHRDGVGSLELSALDLGGGLCVDDVSVVITVCLEIAFEAGEFHVCANTDSGVGCECTGLSFPIGRS